MASVSNEAGLRIIQFIARNGKRQSLRLGRLSAKHAETAKLYVEDLLVCQRTGGSPKPATADWVAGLPDKLHTRLVRHGLLSPRQTRDNPTVAAWVRSYIDGRTDVKPNTRSNFEQAYNSVLAFFRDKRVGDVTAADADAFRVFLKGVGLGEGTIRRRCKRVRQFFAAACKAELIAKNPLVGLKCGTYADSTRFYFVSQAEAQAVLEACPDAEWRLIFALARYGGLRCPSEILALTWGDVDWERQRFLVRSDKTAHNDGGAARVVPIFAELAPYLQDAFDRAEPGQVHAVTRYRCKNQNLRTQLERIIAKAKLTGWPKLFQNLRATRETELVQTFPLHVVCRWLGNTATIAAKHYLNVTEKDFAQAVQKPVQNPVQQPSAKDGQARNASQAWDENHTISAVCGASQINAAPCENREPQSVPPTGLEPVSPG